MIPVCVDAMRLTNMESMKCNDNVDMVKQAIIRETIEAIKDPQKAFRRIYNGGMIHEDGSLKEELFL